MTAHDDRALREWLVKAETELAGARREAALTHHPSFDSIVLLQREIAELHDLIARDANKETGK